MAITYVYTALSGTVTIDFTNQIISCSNTMDDLEIQEVLNACREAEYSTQGFGFSKICNASGKEYLDINNNVQVGITLVLLDGWVIYTEKDSGVFRVLGGNLVQVTGGNPFAPNPDITYINIQSAASTIVSVSTGSGLSTAEHNRLFAIPVTTLETDERAAILSTSATVTNIETVQGSQGQQITRIETGVGSISADINTIDSNISIISGNIGSIIQSEEELAIQLSAVQTTVNLISNEQLIVITSAVNDLQSGNLTEERFKQLMFNKVNTIVNQLITKYRVNNEFDVNVAYDSDSIPTSETMS